jgi:hypothetical protein
LQTSPDLIAIGNIGCIIQIASGSIPVLHTTELLDFAQSGPRPLADMTAIQILRHSNEQSN